MLDQGDLVSERSRFDVLLDAQRVCAAGSRQRLDLGVEGHVSMAW